MVSNMKRQTFRNLAMFLILNFQFNVNLLVSNRYPKFTNFAREILISLRSG